MKMLIGLTGLARSGKDTIASYLTGRSGCSSYAFAKPAKEACKIIFNWTEDHVNGHLKETVDPFFGVSPRVALQTLCTEWGRDTVNSSLWLLRAQSEINKNNPLVITDVRFNNEAEMIKENNGLIIEVVRNDKIAVNPHVSESGIDASLVDYRVENNGTIYELYDKIAAILKKHEA